MHHYRPQPSWDKVIFSQASVILSTGGGGGVRGCRGGMHGCWGRVWLGGVCGCGGVCAWLQGGRAWWRGSMPAWNTTRYGQ